jgi:hypothetical protein
MQPQQVNISARISAGAPDVVERFIGNVKQFSRAATHYA